MAQSEKTLMAKTKKELVAIILRKDDVEVKLQHQVKDLEETNKYLNEDNKSLRKDLRCAQEDVADTAELVKAHIYDIRKLAAKVKLYKYTAIGFAIVSLAIATITLFS